MPDARWERPRRGEASVTVHHDRDVFWDRAARAQRGGDEIARNLVFSTCRESGDHGPFNSWDRQPFLTTVRTGEPSMVMQWREIHHNFFVDNYSPQENVDNDDGSSGYDIHHNVFFDADGFKMDYGWPHTRGVAIGL